VAVRPSDRSLSPSATSDAVDSPRALEVSASEPLYGGAPARTQPAAEDRRLALWQWRLLPLMSAALILLGGFFVWQSVYEMRQLQAFVRQPTPFDARVVSGLEGVDPGSRALIALEVHSLHQRERFIQLTVSSRMWTRYMAFITGMVLAIVGATFVLGRLQESGTQLSGEASGVKMSVQSASPGLILATLGTALMLAAILPGMDINNQYAGVYVGAEALVDTSQTPTEGLDPPPTDGSSANSRAARRDSVYLKQPRGGQR